MGDCFLRAVFLKIEEISQSFWLLYSKVKIMYLSILTKIGLCYSLGDFLQTHLVTMNRPYTNEKIANDKMG
jgi:hypothetical protein